MSQDRIEGAVQRIELALTRIARVADNLAAMPPPDANSATEAAGQAEGIDSEAVSALVNRHEALRESASEALREIDRLIGELEE